MRVLITGGGTAGHVNPALAIADIILDREPDSVIEYVGTEKGIEGRLVAKRGMKLHPIDVMGLSRSLSLVNLKAFALAVRARKRCKRIIIDFAPDVVIGTGGYVCWPLISAAASMKISTVLHESNAEPGFTVKTLKNQADLILVNFEGTKAWLRGGKSRVERVGMPVNKDFLSEIKRASRAHISSFSSEVRDAVPTSTDNITSGGVKTGCGALKNEIRILSFGGSLGAQTVNLCALRLMKELATQDANILIEHSCGTRQYEAFQKEFYENGLDAYPNIVVRDYIYDMPRKMAEADLVICRSGASTLAEIATCGKASVLIPSPNVTGDQQRKNANQLREKNAAVVLEDAEAPEKIVSTVRSLLTDRAKLLTMERNVRSFAFSDCDERIYTMVVELVEKQK